MSPAARRVMLAAALELCALIAFVISLTQADAARTIGFGLIVLFYRMDHAAKAVVNAISRSRLGGVS